MNLFGKILASIGVLAAGLLLMAGSFWLNFRNFKIDFNPALQLQTNSGGNAVSGGKNSGNVTGGNGNDQSITVPVAIEKKTVGGEAAPEKLKTTPDKVSAPAVQNLEAVSDEAASNYVLTRQGVVDQTNQQRQINLGPGYPLAENQLLDQAAQAKVDDMFAGKYFEHMSPQGHDAAYFIGSTGYAYVAIGENLAMGNYEGDEALVKAWMDSPGHRENILKKGFKEIGVAVGYGNFNGRMTWLAVQEFGTPESACPAVDEKLSVQVDSEKNELDIYAKDQDSLSAAIDMKKDVVESLEGELNDQAASSNSYSAIKETQEKLNDAIAEVNSLIDEYNASVTRAKAIYEQYKDNVEEYNLQVNAYNACIGAI